MNSMLFMPKLMFYVPITWTNNRILKEINIHIIKWDPFRHPLQNWPSKLRTVCVHFKYNLFNPNKATGKSLDCVQDL